jgi:hypothetical protein
MTECIAQLRLSFYQPKPVAVTFDAPQITSEGGAVLLRQVDDQLGLSAGFAAAIPEQRDATRTTHDRREQVRQRLYQIALGYEDCNDADRLRCDPLLKTVCERDPEDPAGRSSQPTLSRFENAADRGTIKRLLEQFEQRWVEALAADTEVVVLDIDTTDDPTHGAQQLSFFHGYYDHHIYHPRLIFDGEGQLVSAILRPGNTHAARGRCWNGCGGASKGASLPARSWCAALPASASAACLNGLIGSMPNWAASPISSGWPRTPPYYVWRSRSWKPPPTASPRAM